MSVSVKVENNVDKVLSALPPAKEIALEMIGIKAEKYAKENAPVGTPESTGKKGYQGGTLRNSISHAYDEDSAYVGTNVEYAPYQELGFTSVAGRHIPPANEGRGYLKPAVMDHIDEYKDIVEKVLRG